MQKFEVEIPVADYAWFLTLMSNNQWNPKKIGDEYPDYVEEGK